MEQELLTAKEAMELLHKEKSAFYDAAKRGVYPSVKHKGRLLFPREAIETAAFLEGESEDEGFTFGRATNADIWERIQRNLKIYGPEDMISYRRSLEWVGRNKDICMSMYDNGVMCGGLVAMPLDEPVILALCRDELRERDIPLSAIHKWSEKNLSVYFPTISIVPSGDEHRDAKRGAFLIRSAIRWCVSLHVQYDIKAWYGIGVTPEGTAILEALGFQRFLSLENGERNSYRLNSLKDGSYLLRNVLAKVESGDVLLS